MKSIAVINQKGGVGKTTSVMNIGAGLAALGKKTLLIDMDPQANLTVSLGMEIENIERTVFDLLKEEASAADVIIPWRDFFVMPATIELSAAEVELAGTAGREFLLREALPEAPAFDYVLIDCPPSLGLLTLNALTAAADVYIPVQTEYLAMQGMSTLLNTIEIVQKRLNRNLSIAGIIATRYDKRKRLNNEVLTTIREHFSDLVFESVIRENISLAEAPSHGATIFEYKPDSFGAEDYSALSKEILQRNS